MSASWTRSWPSPRCCIRGALPAIGSWWWISTRAASPPTAPGHGRDRGSPIWWRPPATPVRQQSRSTSCSRARMRNLPPPLPAASVAKPVVRTSPPWPTLYRTVTGGWPKRSREFPSPSASPSIRSVPRRCPASPSSLAAPSFCRISGALRARSRRSPTWSIMPPVSAAWRSPATGTAWSAGCRCWWVSATACVRGSRRRRCGWRKGHRPISSTGRPRCSVSAT